MTRRKPYTRVVKKNRIRAEYAKGMGDVVFKGFQYLSSECQEFIFVRQDKIGDDFEIVCPGCGSVMRSGDETLFFEYELTDLRDDSIIKQGTFTILHDDYIEEAQEYKYCVLCSTIKPLSVFDRHSRRKSGRQSECRLCKVVYNSIKNQTRLTDQHREAAQKRRMYLDLSGGRKIDSQEVYKRFGHQCFKCKKDLRGVGVKERPLDHTLPAVFLWPLTTENATGKGLLLGCISRKIGKVDRFIVLTHCVHLYPSILYGLSYYDSFVKRRKHMESPKYVQTSLAAAMSLGYKRPAFRRDSYLTGLNLLVTYPEGCVGRCGFCGLSRQRQVEPDKRTFIRVDWPTHPVDDVIARLNQNGDRLQRVCVGMITHRNAFDDMNIIIRRFHTESDRPISALIAPTLIRDLSRLGEIKEAGADIVTVAVDAATPELFDRYRGHGIGGPHRWEHYWAAVEESVRVMGRYQAGVHLIVGLGETEREMIATIQRAQDTGAHTHLFSFFPEAGSPMERHPQPTYGHYRRVQLARYIINEEYGRYEQMTFNDAGQVMDFGVETDELIQYGEPFMTSGCPGPDGRVACNRPFGNERPGRPIRNYAFPPEPEDVELIRYQLRDYG